MTTPADPRIERVAQILATNDPLREPHRGAGPWQPPPVTDWHRSIARRIVESLDDEGGGES
jgi:hypothetical protein